MKKKELVKIIKNKIAANNSTLLTIYGCCIIGNKKSAFLSLLKQNPKLSREFHNDEKSKETYLTFQKSGTCNHPVRQKVSRDNNLDTAIKGPLYECVLCGHTIPANINIADWFERHFYEDCVFFENSDIDVLNLLLEVIKDKADDDEIDLVAEFKKIDPDSEICTVIDDKRPDNYIIIIDNSINEYSNLTPIEIELLSGIAKINGIRLQLISNTYYHSSYLRDNGYRYSKDFLFNDAMNNQWTANLEKTKKECLPIKLIINLSQDSTYFDVESNQDIPLDRALSKMFPSSIIINIPELSEEIVKELLEYIQSLVTGSSIDISKYHTIRSLVKPKKGNRNGK